MKVDSTLIRVRSAQPPVQRTLWGAVTFGFWALYVYLWWPALTLLLWVLGFQDAYRQLYERSEQLDPFLLVILPAVALVSATVLIIWAEYNRARFTGRERRHPFPDVTTDEISRVLGAGDGVAAKLASGRITVLHMDDAARPRAATALDVASAPKPADPDWVGYSDAFPPTAVMPAHASAARTRYDDALGMEG